MRKITRRNMLATTAAAVAAVAPAVAVASSARAEIDALLERRIALDLNEQALGAQHRAAQATMPWWAQPGPSHIRHDGTWTDDDWGWPAIDNGELPRMGMLLNKRPSPSDLASEFESIVTFFPEDRARARGRYREQMRALVARVRRQRAEEEKAGLPAIDAQAEATEQEIIRINRQLRRIYVGQEDLPQKAVALILLDIIDQVSGDRVNDEFPLLALMPAVTGAVRGRAEQVIAHRGRTVRTLPFFAAAA